MDPIGRTPERVSKYVANCPSGFGDGASLLKMVDVVALLRRESEWRAGSVGWLADCEAAMLQLDSYMSLVPEIWWPTQRRQLARLLLQKRLQWLRSSA